jgi:GlpG protein
MAEIKAFDVALGEDLREISLYWWQQGIAHRISEQAGRQTIWVGSASDIARVQESYRRWRRQGLEVRPPDLLLQMPSSTRRQLPRLPVTLVGILLSIIGFLLVFFEPKFPLWIDRFTFTTLWWNGQQMVPIFPFSQPWRVLTPIFLHFSLLHIVFNMLWYWDLAGRVERQQGSWRLLWVAVVIGVLSNIAQALHSPGVRFGGMSGVIYGLLGYCWLWGRLRHSRELAIPKPVMVVMVAFMVICMAGFTELVGLGATANAAHLVGLLVGLALGGLTALFSSGSRIDR